MLPVKKRILHLIDTIDIGGAEKLLCNTIGEMPEYEHLIVTLFPLVQASLLPSNAKHISLDAGSLSRIPLRRGRYRSILREYRPDFVHAHLYFSTIFAKWATPRRIPLVFTQHFEFSKNATKWYYRTTDRLLSNYRQHCIAVSHCVLKDYLATTSFPGKTHVIGNYIPPAYFGIHRDGTVPGRIRAVAVGNIKPIKNQQFIVNAFRLLKDVDACCDIYGEGHDRLALQEEAESGGVQVFFKGSIAEARSVLGQYDVYIMPSLTEGFPLSLFEAMASGLPVIVSDIAAFRELLEDEGNYIDLGEPASLRPFVKKFLDEPGLVEKEGTRMRAIAREKVSRDIYFAHLNAVYAELLAGR